MKIKELLNPDRIVGVSTKCVYLDEEKVRYRAEVWGLVGDKLCVVFSSEKTLSKKDGKDYVEKAEDLAIKRALRPWLDKEEKSKEDRDEEKNNENQPSKTEMPVMLQEQKNVETNKNLELSLNALREKVKDLNVVSSKEHSLETLASEVLGKETDKPLNLTEEEVGKLNDYITRLVSLA